MFQLYSHVSFRGVIHIQNSLQVTIVQQQSWKLKWQLMVFHWLYPPNSSIRIVGVFRWLEAYRAVYHQHGLMSNIDTQNSYISKEFQEIQRVPEPQAVHSSIFMEGPRVIPKNLTFLNECGGIKCANFSHRAVEVHMPAITKTGPENRSS